jgi:two-component system chemotaxis response regulator CheB
MVDAAAHGPGLDAIVIGGSAGALEPLLALVADLSPALTTPIVIVMHLHPSFPSLVPSLVARAAGRRAHEAEDKEPLTAGAIVVAPPNYHLLLERSRRLALSVDEPVLFSRPSIDVLFESAAAALGARLAGVVLSGSNADGAAGLAAIAAAGGVAVVQADAQFTAMPAAARARVPAAAPVAAADLADHLARLAGVRPSLGAS